ncbi:MAG: hypothetical protein ACPG49_11165 [Chitinophagales bacterium]
MLYLRILNGIGIAFSFILLIVTSFVRSMTLLTQTEYNHQFAVQSVSKKQLTSIPARISVYKIQIPYQQEQ